VLQTIGHFLSLVRFSHTIFALPFALLATLMAWRMRMLDEIAARDGQRLYFTASGNFRYYQLAVNEDLKFEVPFLIYWQELAGILLCMVAARSAAMAFNRLADRRLDAGNPRTAGRHLPAGTLGVGEVTLFAVVCCAGFVASTLLFLPNRLPLYLSAPVLALLLGYSYAKRFTALAHYWLGLALALSPIAAWIAIRGESVMQRPSDLLPAVVLGAAVAAWVGGFDVIYACQDVVYDRQAGLRSIPVRLGVAGALRLAAASHLATIVLLACVPKVFPQFGWIWWAGIAAVAVLLVYEHALVRPNDLTRVNAAFFNVNAIISIGLLFVGGFDLVLS
jgi:4-hydroxybenzoate polyprenyltransferase